jgi:hypothetical protein
LYRVFNDSRVVVSVFTRDPCRRPVQNSSADPYGTSIGTARRWSRASKLAESSGSAAWAARAAAVSSRSRTYIDFVPWQSTSGSHITTS